MSPLIITLKLDATSFEKFNQLRQQYFPQERNFLPAHITLFHALPGEQEASIRQTLEQICQQTSVLLLGFLKVRSLGSGVAIEVHCAELIQLRNQLASRWNEWLTPQDRQRYRPHITIQNKVKSQEARQLFEDLDRQWQVSQGAGEGLFLWEYRGGPWRLVGEFGFMRSQDT